MANRIVSVHAGIYGMGIYMYMGLCCHLVGSRSLIGTPRQFTFIHD